MLRPNSVATSDNNNNNNNDNNINNNNNNNTLWRQNAFDSLGKKSFLGGDMKDDSKNIQISFGV